MKVRAGLIAVTVTGGLFLTACSSGTSTVSGLQDDTKHIKAKYVTATKTVNEYQKQCTTKTKRTKHTSGTGKNKRTWYTNDTYQSCKQVKTGSHQEKYKKKVRSEKFCVELDNVNGKSRKDDKWFTTSSTVYLKAVARNEGDKVKSMEYYSTGC